MQINRRISENPSLLMWTWTEEKASLYGTNSVVLSLQEGLGFLKEASRLFDYPASHHYDPARCGAFADWLEENEDRLLEGFSTEDRPLAQERLQALRQWLRSGFQPKE